MPATYGEAAAAAKELPLAPSSGGYTTAEVMGYLGFALLGGLILNLMPCV
jgi:thiol:disulfide interchange protein